MKKMDKVLKEFRIELALARMQFGDTIDSPNKLKDLLLAANRAYRLGSPFISDRMYDALELLYGKSLPINDVCTLGEKVHHAIPMLSQQKTYNVEDVKKFLMRNCSPSETYIATASLKMDGFAVELEYKDCILVRASTRGNGHDGQDITDHVLGGCANVPHYINHKLLECPKECLDHFYVRGEMIIPKDGNYACPRNVCVGAFQRSTPDPMSLLELKPSFLAYDIVGLDFATLRECDDSEFRLGDMHSDALWLAGRLEFEVVPYINVTKDKACNLEKEIITPLHRLVTDELPWDADGIVFRLNNNSTFAAKGATKHHPKGSIALKFDTSTAITKIVSITNSVGATGRVTPIITVEPVELSGATITKVSCGSVPVLNAFDLHPGDNVEITRRGGVIPVVVRKVIKGK